MAIKKMTPISVRLGKTVVTGGAGTGATQIGIPQQTAPITGAPITGVEKIDVKTPPFVGIGKEPHNRPQIPMTEPDVPNYSGTGTNYNDNIPPFGGGGKSSKSDNN